MNTWQLLPTEANIARFRAELAGAAEDELMAQEAKDPDMAPGIAARQLLAERRAKRGSERWKPHWTQTAGFVATVVSGLVGVIAWLYPRQPGQDTQPVQTPLPPTLSLPAASAVHPLALPATPSSPAASAPPSRASKGK